MVPSPIKPMSIMSTVSSGLESLRGVPGQAFQRRSARLVFATDPAAIADRVEMAEQEGKVDLAGAGLVTTWIVGELDVRDLRQIFLHGTGEIALHDLHVIDVVLDKQIV